MRAILTPSPLGGAIKAIPSKSDAHRALICAALSDKPTKLKLQGFMSEDISATMRCMCALGAEIKNQDGDLIVTPVSKLPKLPPVLDCGESGSTLRFLLPVAAALGCGGTFIGSGRLPERPVGALLETLTHGGASFDSNRLPLTVSGQLRSGAYAISGSISSQFVSGLLLALPLIEGGGTVRLVDRLESSGYVDMTLGAMRRFGVEAQALPDGWRIAENAAFSSPGVYEVEGDFSNAAFFLAAGALGKTVRYTGLETGSCQKDRQIAALIERFGAQVTWENDTCTVSPRKLHGAGDIHVAEIPDLVPILAVIASLSPGQTRLSGAARLRIKESDRLKTTTQMLTNLGADITEGPDFLLISGRDTLSGGMADSFGDHRIAMAASIAATCCLGPVQLTGAQAVNKSYPGFFEDYQKLGGLVDIIND